MYRVVYEVVCASADIYCARVVVSVMGPAGAGKSTVCHSLATLLDSVRDRPIDDNSFYVHGV